MYEVSDSDMFATGKHAAQLYQCSRFLTRICSPPVNMRPEHLYTSSNTTCIRARPLFSFRARSCTSACYSRTTNNLRSYPACTACIRDPRTPARPRPSPSRVTGDRVPRWATRGLRTHQRRTLRQPVPAIRTVLSRAQREFTAGPPPHAATDE